MQRAPVRSDYFAAMTARLFRYPTAGLGMLLFIPWLGVVFALALAYLLFGNPNFLVPSTRPAGYFGLLLAAVTTIYFVRYDWHRRQQFETTDDTLTVITATGKRRVTPWTALTRADYRTNSGALVLTPHTGGSRFTLYPTALEHGTDLVALIDARTSLRLNQIPDLQAALRRAV